MERHRVDSFGDHPAGGTAYRSSSDDGHFDNYRAGFSGSGDGGHHNNLHHQQDYHYSNQYDHRHHSNTEPNDSFTAGGGGGVGGGGFWLGGGNGGGSVPLTGRKRGFHHSGRGASPDHFDRGSFAKLYVASVPRTATEELIRPLFQEYGNIVEVVLIKDKRTGQQQGSCFVKYATVEEADRAIRAVHNQYTFPGEVELVKVRYADGEKERLGALGEKVYVGEKVNVGEKVYVGCLNKQASKKEIEEIFSPYGVVEDIYIIRDELKQSRGCGFVKFSHRDMAAAAMNALNGNYIMRGCDQPLIVRFADPKKPRNGESRGNSAFGGPSFGPRSQEPFTRLTPNLHAPMGGHMLPNASYPSNSAAPVQQISTGSLPEACPKVANLQPVVSNVMQQRLHPLQHSPSQLSQMPSQPTQTLLESRESPQQTVSQTQKQLDLIQPSMENLEQQQRSQVSSHQSPRTGSNPQAVATTSTASTAVVSLTVSAAPMVPVSTQTAAPLDCDWSEHTCPDGYKYYYNCVTFESKWEKPEEYTLFEQRLRKQLQLQKPSSQQFQSLLHQQEINHVHVQSATSPIIACVQQLKGCRDAAG